ncbi:MAG: efflux RND transporter periplasmic adaptor subunit [Planctomycetaceae bacterium]
MRIRITVFICFMLAAAMPTHAPFVRAADRPQVVLNALHTAASTDKAAARRFRETSPGHIPGIARPAERVVLSAPLDGVLMKVFVKEGQNVQAGEILAVMDNRVAKAAVAFAEAAATRNAELDRAKLELSLAEKIVHRQTALVAGKAITEHQLDEAKSRYEQAKADVARVQEIQAQARANLELEQARLESHNIRAPFSGQVLQIHEFAGATFTVQNKLLTLVSMTTLEAELHVPLSLFGVLKPGQQYQLIADEPVGNSLTATLKYRAPMIDSASMSFRCVFVIPNDDLRYPAGFAVKFDAEALESQGKTAQRGQGT